MKRILIVLLLFIVSINSFSQSNKVKFIKRNTSNASLPKVILRKGIPTINKIQASNVNLQPTFLTSAGIFEGDTLRRTLWGGERKTLAQAIADSALWDGKDDLGNELPNKPNGTYSFKLLRNNVKYDWQGIIGNTSTNPTWEGRHNWTDRLYDMRVVGNTAYIVCGYYEGRPSQKKFNLATPNVMEELWTNTADINGTSLMAHVLCTWGDIVYYGGFMGHDTPLSCVWGYNTTTGTEVSFSNGMPLVSSLGRDYLSIVDTVQRVNNNTLGTYIKGIAANEDFLFVARPERNSLKVLNRVTGALVQNLTIDTPRSLYIDSANKLWMVSANGVTKHTINVDGTLSASLLTLTGLSDALSLQVSPDNSTVLIGDGGVNHVYKGFSNSTGELLWTKGTPGGYVNPTITYDKFSFRTGKEWLPNRDNFDATFGTILADGSMWLADMGNQRMIHYASNRTTVLDEIINQGYNYQVAVDRGNPKRVFCNYLEYEIDYSKPLQLGNNSWKLKRNWHWNVTGAKDQQYNRTHNIITLSNGRTYNIIKTPASGWEICDYDTVTGIRYTGMFYPDSEVWSMNDDGSLWSSNIIGVNAQKVYKRRALTGFDVNNNPIYATAVTIETSPTVQANDPVGHAGNGWNANLYTANNIIANFAKETGEISGGAVRGLGYHLGGLKNGKWLWKTSLSTHKNYHSSFPSNGDYDVGNSVQYAGNIVTTLERNIFWGYNGEFWKLSQTNKYNHFYDNGLFVGQFGVTGPEVGRVRGAPKFAGNSLVWNVAKVGENYYMYNADESQHQAFHSWKISGLSTINTTTYPISKTGTRSLPALPYIDLTAGLAYNDTLTSGQGNWTFSPEPYYVNNNNRWIVMSNRLEYRKDKQAGLYMITRPNVAGLTFTATRPITTSALSNWTFDADIAWREGYEPITNETSILDQNGKVIVKFYRVPIITGQTLAVKVNNSTIVQGTQLELLADTKPLYDKANIKITVSGSVITVKLANYPIITTTIFDPTADITRPATLRILLESLTNTSGHQIDIVPRFYPN